MLTDTTFWIDLAEEIAAGESGRTRQFLARHRSASLEVSIVTWGELAAGVDSPAELDHLLRRSGYCSNTAFTVLAESPTA